MEKYDIIDIKSESQDLLEADKTRLNEIYAELVDFG
jgi:hypothetical protein